MTGSRATRMCECGRPRAPRSVACDLCRFLDGASPSEQMLIGLIRANGGCASKETLAQQSRWTIRHLQRKLAKLQRIGRVAARPAGEASAHRLVYFLIGPLDGPRTGGAP